VISRVLRPGGHGEIRVLASSAARDAIGPYLPIVSESDILDVRFIRWPAVVVLIAPPDTRS